MTTTAHLFFSDLNQRVQGQVSQDGVLVNILLCYDKTPNKDHGSKEGFAFDLGGYILSWLGRPGGRCEEASGHVVFMVRKWGSEFWCSAAFLQEARKWENEFWSSASFLLFLSLALSPWKSATIFRVGHLTSIDPL